MSARVYPTVECDLHCEDYEVYIDGAKIQTNVARVSAVPHNRRWPGHQREISQTELIQFVSCESDEKIKITVRPTFPYDKDALRIRPYSSKIKPEIAESGEITFTVPGAGFWTVEPLGRSRALHIFVDPIKKYEAESGREVIYFGKGEHDVGLIELKSNQTLFIDEGAVVYARIEGTDCENVSIIGRGILDNSRNREIILYEANVTGNDSAVLNAKRFHTVSLKYCKNILIDGITIRDSLVYNIRPVGCTDFTVRNVKIIGCWRYNSDGIDMHNCRNVLISDCFIRTYDDSICVKGYDFFQIGDPKKAYEEAVYHGNGVYDTFENVRVERCVIWNDWGKALEIGAETMAREISNIHFSDCDLIHLTRYGVDCMNVDFADVHDVTFERIRMEADDGIGKPVIQTRDGEKYENPDPDYMPCAISVSVESHHEYSAIKGLHGKNRNFVFNDIDFIGPRPPELIFFGYSEEFSTSNVEINNIRHCGKRMTKEDVNLGIKDYAYEINFR